MTLLLIRYNELGLKSPRVRARFQKRMIHNIEDKFLAEKLDSFIDSDWGRIYLHTDDESKGINLLTKIFGISSVSPVIDIGSELDEITDTVVEYTRKLLERGQSFALRTRRQGKHEYTSMDIAKHVGSAILEQLSEMDLKVNLRSPDVEIFIEVRRKHAYIFSQSYPGPGGLPLGTQGKILSIFTDERSYIASWLMMKRGCRVYPVYFQTQTTEDHANQLDEPMANEQLEQLKQWAPNLKLKLIELKAPGTENELGIDLDSAELIQYSKFVKAKGICLSTDLAGFSNVPTPQTNDLPVFYPLIGLKKNMIKDLEFKILGNKT